MIEIDKLSFWIDCQLDDIKEEFDKNPTQYLYGAMQAYRAMGAQLSLVEGSNDD